MPTIKAMISRLLKETLMWRTCFDGEKMEGTHCTRLVQVRLTMSILCSLILFWIMLSYVFCNLVFVILILCWIN